MIWQLTDFQYFSIPSIEYLHVNGDDADKLMKITSIIVQLVVYKAAIRIRDDNFDENTVADCAFDCNYKNDFSLSLSMWHRLPIGQWEKKNILLFSSIIESHRTQSNENISYTPSINFCDEKCCNCIVRKMQSFFNRNTKPNVYILFNVDNMKNAFVNWWLVKWALNSDM